MDLINKIEELTKQGYMIDYRAIDQYENGYKDNIKNGSIPAVTYTVYVTSISDGEIIYSESFDHIETALKSGIEYIKLLLNEN